MEKRGFILVVVLIVAATMLAGNLGNQMTGQQTFARFTPALTEEFICGPLQGYEKQWVTTGQGATFPVPVPVSFYNMPNALKQTTIKGIYRLNQGVDAKGIVDFTMSNAIINFKNFYFHIPDGQPLINYRLSFYPAIPLNNLERQGIYLLGRYYRVQKAGKVGGDVELILQSCKDAAQNAPLIHMIGDANFLQVDIDGEIMEDVTGNIITDANGDLRSMLWTNNVDGAPGYSGLWLADGDLRLSDLLDEPQSLLGLDADVTTILLYMQPIVKMEYELPYY